MLEYRYCEQIILGVFFAMAILLALALKAFLKDKDVKWRRLPLQIISVLIIVFEIFKQVKNITGYETSSFVSFLTHDTDSTFSTYALPFHFCSFFVFWPIFAALTKGKMREFFNNMTFLWSTFISIYMFIYPVSVMGNATERLFNHETIEHTTVFHCLVFLYFVISVALRTFEFKANKFWTAMCAFGIYALLAIPAAFIFDANYCSIKEPEAFPFLYPIQESSYFLYETILVLAGCIVCLIIYFSVIGIGKLRSKVQNHTPYFVAWLALGASLPFVIFLLEALFTPDALAPKFSLILLGIGAVYLIPAVVASTVKRVKCA